MGNMVFQDELKKQAAHAALSYIEDDMVIGVGSGSTVNAFIDELASIRSRIDGCVAASQASIDRLKSRGIPVLDLNAYSQVMLYIDGADEINPRGEMKKGGGGALLKEKIIATYSKQFICLADESKFQSYWGDFPIPVEVHPMARSAVGRELVKLGGSPVYREGYLTDNGNIILDVYQLDLVQPSEMEQRINQIVGVIENGIFSHRRANLLLLATQTGIQKHTF
jgi:ribose 5-phosphate isomerase A